MFRLKYLFVLAFVFMINDLKGQIAYKIPDIPMMISWDVIDFIHVNFTLPGNEARVEVGDKIGEIMAYPVKLSERFEVEIRLAEKYYDKGDFKAARSVLEKPLKMESSNPFILNNYARACYQIDRAISFKIYFKLINYLDSIYKKPDSQIVVDMWFREAYWKLGTLYMDNKNWDKAKFEISRFLLSIQEHKTEYIYSQALEYLTECAYNQYDDKLAYYLANRTLIYNPKNAYVKGILKKLAK